MMSASLPIRAADESSTLEAEKAKLSAAVAKFDEHLSTFVSSQNKSSTALTLTLGQITTGYELAAANSDADTRDNKFAKAVEQLILANVHEEPVDPGLGPFRKKMTKMKDGTKGWIQKTGTFMGRLLPLAIVACGLTASLGDVCPMEKKKSCDRSILTRTTGHCNGVSSEGSCEWCRNSSASKLTRRLLSWTWSSIAREIFT
jgi:hypothetical protein